MREGSVKKNSYGKSRNGRTNINMEGQRSNDGDESETSESFGVPCNICCYNGNHNNVGYTGSRAQTGVPGWGGQRGKHE